jgi:hypothetical protein
MRMRRSWARLKRTTTSTAMDSRVTMRLLRGGEGRGCRGIHDA